MATQGSASYRPDVDGLRAVAVLSVVLYHLSIGPIHGGFVGVDVFFVISGYLIGNLVLDDVARGRFSLRDFYERRFRRILPALFVMILAMLAVLMLVAWPVVLIEYARSGIAALFSVSNLYFWQITDYFNPESKQNFLLHTWSLGVEEQYYLLFPPIAMLVGHYARHRIVPVLAGLALASLLVSIWLVDRAPTAGYYLLPSRGWELLVGALAGRLHFASLDAPRRRNIVALAGMAAIVVPMFAYGSATAFPGLAALPPVLGAAMVIVSGRHGDTLVRRGLSLKPMVFIGLISYSLYLWHWPLQVLAQQLITEPQLDRIGKLTILAASFGCAVLSWRYVELPFRSQALFKGGPLFGRPSLSSLRVVMASSATAVALCTGIIISAGVPGRFDASAERYAAQGSLQQVGLLRQRNCFIEPDDGIGGFDQDACMTAMPGRANVLLLGDSHAASLYSGLADALPRANVLQATASNCRPLLSSRTSPKRMCAALMQRVFDDLLQRRAPDLVIMVANWADRDMADVRPTLDWFAARHIPVVVVGPITTYDMPLPRLLAMARARGDMALPETHRVPGRERMDTILRSEAARSGAGFVSMIDMLCARRCTTVTPDDMPLLFDTGHLSPQGAQLVAPDIADAVTARLPQREVPRTILAAL